MPPDGAPTVYTALASAAESFAASMDWRGVAAAEAALRRLAALCGAREHPVGAGLPKSAGEGATHYYGAKLDRAAASAMRALAVRAGEACAAASAYSRAASANASDLLVRSLGSAVGLLVSARKLSRKQTGALLNEDVLLVGSDPGSVAADALAGIGARVHRWRRFAADKGGDVQASPWPAPPPDQDGVQARYAAAALRIPPSTEAFALAVDAVASVLCEGGGLLLYGRVDEGATEAALRGALGLAYEEFVQLAVMPDGAAVVFFCRRSAAPPSRGRIEAWQGAVSVQLRAAAAAPPMPVFCTFPGLFAGGDLDIMTEALLDCLPAPLPRARVLDFGCGSGTLGAALALRDSTLRLTLLDADALAVVAAQKNMDALRASADDAVAPRRSARVVLSDGFNALPARRRFDLIVSNPPVHAGAADDFSVLTRLLTEAPGRLRRGGSLWLVAQAQVPVGRLAAFVGGWRRCRPVAIARGRFVAWHAEPSTVDAAGGDSELPAQDDGL